MDPPSATHVRELSRPCESLLTRGVSADMECQERVDTGREVPAHFIAADPARCPNACPLEEPALRSAGVGASLFLSPLVIFFGSKSVQSS
jgi:hypothetical protein